MSDDVDLPGDIRPMQRQLADPLLGFFPEVVAFMLRHRPHYQCILSGNPGIEGTKRLKAEITRARRRDR